MPIIITFLLNNYILLPAFFGIFTFLYDNIIFLHAFLRDFAFLFDNIIFLSVLDRTLHSWSCSSRCSLFIFWFGLFSDWLGSRRYWSNRLLWRRNIFLNLSSINCLRFSCRFSNLAISKCYWSFSRAIRDSTTSGRDISYMRVIVLRVIRIWIINFLNFLPILKWNIRTLVYNLNRFDLRSRNINIIYLICYILWNFLFLFQDAILDIFILLRS